MRGRYDVEFSLEPPLLLDGHVGQSFHVEIDSTPSLTAAALNQHENRFAVYAVGHRMGSLLMADIAVGVQREDICMNHSTSFWPGMRLSKSLR